MTIEGFLAFIITVFLTILLSHLIARIAGNLLTSQRGLRFFITPGVAAHEGSHAIPCLLTGAKITEVNLFAPEGGYVKHGQPKVRFIGSPAISLAPLIGCTLILWLISFIFHYLNLLYIPMDIFHLGNDFISALTTIFVGLYLIFEQNLIPFDLLSLILLIIYLYLVFSITAAIAPSSQDFKNSAVFIVVLFLLAFALIIIKPLSYLPIASGSGTPFLDITINILGGVVSLAMGLEIIAVIILGIIFIPVYIKRRH